MDVGFVLLCPDRNLAALKNSLGSIRHHAYDRESVAAVGDDISAKELKEMKEYCPTHKGKDTITSLVNIGMKKLKNEWGFIMFAGSRIQPSLERKLETFTRSEKDVLFPIVDNRYDFISGSFNGVLINRAFFSEVGDFPSVPMYKEGMNDFEMAKMIWGLDAMEKGAIFKGIVGMKIV